MRPVLFIAFILLLSAECASAQYASPQYAAADTTAPTTADARSVLILPFTPPAGTDYQWVGQSVQQVLAADLAHGSTLKVIAPASAKPAANADAALRSATDAGASIVVFGQTQVLDKEIRLTGEMLDVATGRSITGMKSTGPIDQLFHLEDAVASQSLNALPERMRDDEWRNHTGYASTPSAQSSEPSPSVYDYGSAPYDSGGYSYSYPSYSYYSYPAYPYSYYYPYGFYGGLFFNFHDHDDHHDHHDDFHNHGDSHDHGDFHGHGDFAHNDFHGNSDFHSGFTGGSGGFSRGAMPRSGMTAPRGGMTFGGSSGGFSGAHAGGFSGARAGGFSGGGVRGGGGGGGGGFHGGGMGGHR